MLGNGKMRAAVPADGRIEIVEVPVPTLGPREVLVEVRAAGMNRADLLHRQGKYGQRAFLHPDRPNIAGMEMAGKIVAVGSAANREHIGRGVMAMCAGAYAEYVAVDERLLLPAPPGLDWAGCAALPMALLTEFEALVRLAGVRPGHRVLVTGATSGVGLIGVQLAKALKAGTVIGTTRSRQAAGLLRSLGADLVVHDEHELAESLADEGVDVVVDHVGGPMFETCVPLVRKGACLVSVGRLGGRTATVDLAALSSQRARLIGTTWRTQELSEIAYSVDALQDVVFRHVLDGSIAPIAAQQVPFPEIDQGYESLSSARDPGKLAVIF